MENVRFFNFFRSFDKKSPPLALKWELGSSWELFTHGEFTPTPLLTAQVPNPGESNDIQRFLKRDCQTVLLLSVFSTLQKIVFDSQPGFKGTLLEMILWGSGGVCGSGKKFVIVVQSDVLAFLSVLSKPITDSLQDNRAEFRMQL